MLGVVVTTGEALGSNANPRSRLGWLELVGALFLTPAVVRLTLTIDNSLTPGIADARGWLADLALSGIVAAVVGTIAGDRAWKRSAGAAAVGVWSMIHFANYEHVSELGSVINILNVGFVTDATFLRGSALAPTRPWIALLTSLVAVALAWHGLRSDSRAPSGKVLLAALGTGLVAAALPTSRKAAEWRQADLATIQLQRLWDRSEQSARLTAMVTGGRLDPRDLDGHLIVTPPAKKPNVLLVIAEGVSGAYLPSLRQAHGVTAAVNMPELDRIAQSGLAYPSFIATQRQTNRGVFALLCGEYPKLVTAEAKMTEAVGSGPIDCLPAVLRDSGYRTVYLQAAPLAFMLKDQFMAAAGYDEVYGNSLFEHAHHRNHWGVDDATLFEEGLQQIRRLERDDRPWFLTLLTVGTHHRYNVPPEFIGHADPGSPAWAFEYLDLAIGRFVAELERLGLREDTLILITSDESQAMDVGASDVTNAMRQAWGLLIALVPNGETGQVQEIFTQPDVPVSVLDYLGIDSSDTRFGGRSVFRSYQRHRALYWGNTHMGMVSGLSEAGTVTVCSEAFTPCGTFSVGQASLFSPHFDVHPAADGDVEWLRGAVARSLPLRINESRVRSLVLIPPGLQAVVPTPGEQYVFGGQFVTVPAHSKLDLNIAVTLQGQAGAVTFAINLIEDRRPLQVWSDRLRAGETLELETVYTTDLPLREFECRFWITARDGEGLALDFREARLEIAPLDASQPVPPGDVRIYRIGNRTLDMDPEL